MNARERYLFEQFREAITAEYAEDESSFPRTYDAFRYIYDYINAHYALSKFAGFTLKSGLERPYIPNYQIFQIEFNLDFLHDHVIHVDDLKLLIGYEFLFDIVNVFLSTLKFGYQFNQLCMIDYRYEQLVYENMIGMTCLPLIRSTLPERCYSAAQDVEILKQRDPKLWRQLLPQSSEDGRKALTETIKYQREYLTTFDMKFLHNYLHCLVEYLLAELPEFMTPPEQPECDDSGDDESGQETGSGTAKGESSNEDETAADKQPQMKMNCLPQSKFCYTHQEECETVVAGRNQPLDVDHEGKLINDFDAQGDPHGSEPRTLKVPIVDAASVNAGYFLPSLNDFTRSCERMETYLIDFFKSSTQKAHNGQLYSSYASPSGTDIVKLSASIMTPWIKTQQVQPPVRVVMFDVSGSMIPYLHLAVSVLEQFADQVDAIFGFSTIVSNIYRKAGFYEAYTTQGTSLKCITEFMLKNYNGGELYIISDGYFGDMGWREKENIKHFLRFSSRFQTILLHVGEGCRLPDPEFFRCRRVPVPS